MEETIRKSFLLIVFVLILDQLLKIWIKTNLMIGQEIHIFDWRNVPHSTANTSYVPRVSLQLTGTKTEDTDAILNERDHYYSVE